MSERDTLGLVDRIKVPIPRRPEISVRFDNQSVIATDKAPAQHNNLRNKLTQARDTLARKWGVDKSKIQITVPTREPIQSQITRRELPPAQRQPEEHVIFHRLLPEDPDTLNGDDLVTRRHELGLSQRALARLARLEPATIVRFERNRNKSIKSTRDALYQAFAMAYHVRDDIALELGIDPKDVPFTKLKGRLTPIPPKVKKRIPKLDEEIKKVAITPNMSSWLIIEIWRGERELQQKELAALAGVSESIIEKIAQRRRPLTRAIARALCVAFGFSETDPRRTILLQKVEEEDRNRRELRENEFLKNSAGISAFAI